MRAGGMRYHLQLFRPVQTTNEYGEEQTTYTPTRTIWAERVKWAGNRSEEVGEHFAAYTVTFRIRDVHPIGEGWRVQLMGEHLYTVMAIEPNRSKGMLSLLCQRVNV
nr:MAG TPA: Putative head tail adaptor [Caudoviricetes sp.]DAW38878.1 MAG TPA: Putative head tail adaptor [Caudoviricetes sp.]